MSKLLKLFLVGAALMTAQTCCGQDADIGIRPYGPYFNADFYHVNLQNGNVYGEIPLVSMPQKGKLPPLTYFVNVNTAPYTYEETCSAAYAVCYLYYDFGAVTPGVQLNTSYSGGTFTEAWPCVNGTSQYCGSLPIPPDEGGAEPPVFEAEWYVNDLTGSTHPMLYDLSDFNRLYAADGSGYSIVIPPGDGTSMYSPSVEFLGTVYSPDGISYSLFSSSSSAAVPNQDGIKISDPMGNTVQRDFLNWTQATGEIEPHIVDSLGNSFPDPTINPGPPGLPDMAYSNDVSQCPNLGHANQTPLFSFPLSFPGPNGQNTNYLVCYTQVIVHPSFFGFDPTLPDQLVFPLGSGVCPPDYMGNLDCGLNEFTIDIVSYFYAIQSIVLPNSQGQNLATNPYWGFIYDAATVTQSGGNTYSSESYGTLSEVIYPTGAHVNFSYITMNQDGNVGSTDTVRAVSSIDRYDGINGTPAHTAYAYGSTSVSGSTQLFANVTDPKGNITEHKLNPFPVPYVYAPPAYEVQTISHQGGISGAVLKTVNTHYRVDLPATIPNNYSLFNPICVEPDQLDTYVGNSSAPLSTVKYEYPTLFTSAAVEALGLDIEPNLPPNEDPYTYIVYVPGGYPLPYAQPSKTTLYDGSGNLISTTLAAPMFLSDAGKKNANLLDLRGTDEVMNPQNGIASRTTYAYDETGSPQGEYGNLTSTHRWLSTAGQDVVSHIQYGTNGQPSLVTDPDGNKTYIADYDCSGMYPHTVIQGYQSSSASAQTSVSSHDCATGSVTSTTDPNGIITQSQYDYLGRQTKVMSAFGTGSENWKAISYPDFTHVNIAQDKTSKGDGLITSQLVYDGLGREIIQTSPGSISVKTQYDPAGNVASVSNPYPAGSSPASSTSYSYDALGRKTIQMAQDGKIMQWCYDGIASTGQTNCRANLSSFTGGDWVDQADELFGSGSQSSHNSQQVSDAQGRLRSVIEPTLAETTYAYDTLGNLTAVSQNGIVGVDTPRTRSFGYDSLSRLLWAQNPESSFVCYGLGDGTYTGCQPGGYDFNGNLLHKTDARGVQTHYTYDSFNRVLAKTYTSAPAGTLSSCYLYDAASLGVGHLSVEWTQSSACTAGGPSSQAQTQRLFTAYDPLGRALNAQQCVLTHCTTATPPLCPNAASPSQTYCYDLAGNLIWYASGTTAIPNIGGLSFLNAYDAAGRLNGITGSWSDASHPAGLFAATYMPSGAIGTMFLGPNLVVNKTYDQRLRPLTEIAKHP